MQFKLLLLIACESCVLPLLIACEVVLSLSYKVHSLSSVLNSPILKDLYRFHFVIPAKKRFLYNKMPIHIAVHTYASNKKSKNTVRTAILNNEGVPLDF